ncbi:Mu transposase C-terminal domain-containing protein [Serratia fonticola]|uniref:Mu transposase C-terminal domain-containing protein n=1 Tax=Serratia fonticola TaxID=47917 RepID=UPI0027F69C8F|nr:Mu transposase C-terminal domain-containing protein [Serratia fonticola]MDQ7211444.1 Mu transposase C-terminal domain-containing protein [Serratia fonticola]HBE9083029.1 transposase [Serratia fonticola]HBE9093524.1 transposase [Serratia fonticola]HBE9155812.1 transposase [Serratia fonticola]
MYISVNELVGLPGMPRTAQGVRAALNKLAGNSPDMKQKRAGSKAFEYSVKCLPAELQNIIRDRHIASLVSAPAVASDAAKPARRRADASPAIDGKLAIVRQCPAVLDNCVRELTGKQRAIVDARCAVVAEIMRLEHTMRFSRIKAITWLVENARAGTLPPALLENIAAGNAKRGANRLVSTRTLNQWVIDYSKADNAAERLAMMAPAHPQAKRPEQIGWLPRFLAHYRTTHGLNINEAYQAFRDEWKADFIDKPSMLAALPSIYAVRRALNKMPVIEKMRGRVTGSAWRSINPYTVRDWEQMPVNGVWIGDGHNMDVEVAHPIHGQPFSPEITLIMDGRTRYLTGWSLALSENVFAVADALRHGMTHHGKPDIYYSDNGGGEKNLILDAPITGILPRLGVDHRTGIPGNPQGRGIIERINKVIPDKIAKQFATYYGPGADRETYRITSRAIRAASVALKNGKELSTPQKNALAKLPSWQQLLDVIASVIDWYNFQHRHTGLPRRSDGLHFTPAEYRKFVIETEQTAIEQLSDIELRDMFRPQMIRKVDRGMIKIFNNNYFSLDLAKEHGNEVIVSYDIHDGASVIVRRMDGTYICDAIWNGNTRAAFPVTAVDHKQKQRVGGMIKRAEEKITAAKDELNPTLVPAVDFGALIPAEVISDTPQPLFEFEFERDEWERKQRKNRAIGE